MNEQDVRSKINELLKNLGYRKNDIQQEVRVDIQAGCGRLKQCFADYVISVGKKRIVIEAKSSKKNVTNKSVIGQAKSYALYLNAKNFAICNGKDFALYETRDAKLIEFCEMREQGKIKEKISRNQLEPKKQKTIFESFMEGNLQQAKDQGVNIFTKRVNKTLKKVLEGRKQKKVNKTLKKSLKRGKKAKKVNKT